MSEAALSSARVSGGASSPMTPRGLGDPDTIFFGGGLPDPATYPAEAMARILDATTRDIGSGALNYVYELGDIRLREAIAERARRAGATIEADQVILTNGCAGAIELVAKALVDPGDIVVVEDATYVGAARIFEHMGGVVEGAALDGEGLDPAALEMQLDQLARAGKRIKIIYTVATCHNPTTSTLSPDRRRAVIALAERHGAVVVEDYTYGDICFEAPPPPFIALDAARAIHLGSFSKTIAPGLRTGWAAGPRDLVAALVRGRTDLGTSPLLQRSIARFCEDGLFEPHLADVTAHYRRKRDWLIASLDEHCRDLVTWAVPTGGFFVWLTLKVGMIAPAFEAAPEERVAFLPGPYFSVRPGLYPASFRLSFGEVPEARLGEGIARLARALERGAASA